MKKPRVMDNNVFPKEEILQKLFGNELVGYRDQYREMRDLIDHTVSTGGSNSVLLLGPHGVGKTVLVNAVLKDIQENSSIFKADGLVVRLSGLLQTDDKLALKSIAKQLRLENVVGDKVFGSFAEHLEFLLKSLNSGSRQSKPIVFLLEEFHLFCGHHNQTLLYNLFDVAQSRAAPIIVVGVTTELDVVESLEKRVKSRFNHRQITMLPPDTFDEFYSFAKEFLTVDHAHGWNDHLEKLLSTRSVRRFFDEIFSRFSVAFLKQFFVTTISRLSEDTLLSEDDLRNVLSEIRAVSDSTVISDLTVLEMGLLIACNHLDEIYEGESFNFEMVFHEYDKFATQKAKQFKKERAVMAKAWESLIELELIYPIEKHPSTKVLKQFRLYSLHVTPEMVKSCLNNMPQVVKEWASSVYASAS